MQFKVEGCGSQCGFVVGMLTITGNHGTDDRNVPQILKSGFIPSKGRNHWYGEGVYFFIEGINIKSIDVLAEQWARDQSYDKKTKCHKYSDYAVLEAMVNVSEKRIVDLRVQDVLKRVNYIREAVKNECERKGYKIDDCEIWRYMKIKFGIEVVISNTYIKFDDDRRTNIKSFIPNCTVMSVLDECRIDRKSIKLIRKGEI